MKEAIEILHMPLGQHQINITARNIIKKHCNNVKSWFSLTASLGVIMQIISGKQMKPFAIILGGVAGVGKTTWASQAPDPLFIAGDEVSELDVDRLPQVKSWQEFKDQLKWIIDNKPKHKTIVIDTMDHMEKLLHKYLIESDPKGKTSMSEAFGAYGKAYERAEAEMIEVRESLVKPIRDQLNKNIIIIVHSQKIKTTDPFMAIEYETNEMTLHKKVIPVWKDWVSGVFFADFIKYKLEGENTSKVFLSGSGERILRTTQTATTFGKNRFNLPEELPLEFSAFYEKFKAFYESEKPEDIISAINALLKNVSDPKLVETITKQVEDNKTDTKKLNRFLSRVQELTER